MQRCVFSKSQQLSMKVEPTYKCETCHRIFLMKDNLKKHVRHKVCTSSTIQRRMVAELVQIQNTESLDQISTKGNRQKQKK